MMMRINRNNYEAYLLDLLEGRLSAEEQQMVRDFLLLNPDCAGPGADLESWVLEQKEVPFPDREKLKKKFPGAESELTDANFDLFSIARMENDLSPEQKRKYESMVSRDEKKQGEWDAWQRTKLVPPRVVFPGKQRLKRRKGVSPRIIWLSVVSAAAMIALLITLVRIDVGTVVPDPVMESVLPENHPGGGVILEDPVREEPPVVIREREKLASEPVTLSMKKNPDPPELTGTGTREKQLERVIENDRLPQTEPGDTVILAAGKNSIADRIQIAGLDHATLNIMNAGVYDQIDHIELPPGSVHLTSLSITRLSGINLQQLFDDFTEENEISIWSIANTGIKGFNRITGADISLLALKDEEGDISGLHFKSRRFSLSTPLHREE